VDVQAVQCLVFSNALSNNPSVFGTNLLANEDTLVSPEAIWTKYINSGPAEAELYIDSQFTAFFLNSLPPGAFLKTIGIVGTRYYGESAALDIQVDTFRSWLSFKKTDSGWKLSLDENEILEHITSDWHKKHLSKFRFITRIPMTSEQISNAEQFVLEAESMEQKLNLSLSHVDYYVAQTLEDAIMLVGEATPGAGKGRYRSIKTFNNFNHIHEYIHVLAMEIGLVNPFFDEGLATAFEKGTRFRSKIECLAAIQVLQTMSLFDGDKFIEENIKGIINVYGIAQITMRYWIEKFGINSIKAVLKKSVTSPRSFISIMESELEPRDQTISAIHSRISALSETFE